MNAPSRRLTLLDLIALVFASGLSLAAALKHNPDFSSGSIWKQLRDLSLGSGLARDIVSLVFYVFHSLLPALAIFSATVLALSFRPPRPSSRRRLWSQPGVLACLIIAIVTTLTCLIALAGAFSGGEPLENVSFWLIYCRWPLALPGPCIATAWVTLFLTGRWRPERSWIDRMGRLFGWIALIGSTCFIVMLELL